VHEKHPKDTKKPKEPKDTGKVNKKKMKDTKSPDTMDELQRIVCCQVWGKGETESEEEHVYHEANYVDTTSVTHR
jgi:hypothetical protein